MFYFKPLSLSCHVGVETRLDEYGDFSSPSSLVLNPKWRLRDRGLLLLLLTIIFDQYYKTQQGQRNGLCSKSNLLPTDDEPRLQAVLFPSQKRILFLGNLQLEWKSVPTNQNQVRGRVVCKKMITSLY